MISHQNLEAHKVWRPSFGDKSRVGGEDYENKVLFATGL